MTDRRSGQNPVRRRGRTCSTHGGRCRISNRSRSSKKARPRGNSSGRGNRRTVLVAKAYAENRTHTLPQALRKIADKDPQLQEFADRLRKETAKRGQNLELNDFALSVFGINERAHWAKMSEAANFLKHADQDHSASISLSKINTEELLAVAISSYFNLMKKTTPEMGVFMLYQSAKTFDDSAHLVGLDAQFVDALRGIKPELRGRACLEFLTILKRKTAQN